MKLTIGFLLLAVVARASAPAPPRPTQGQIVEGSVVRDGTSEPIGGATVELTVPEVKDAIAALKNLAASFGLPPGAAAEMQEMIDDIRKRSPAQLQALIDEQENASEAREFTAIVTQILAAKTRAVGFPKRALTDNVGRFTFTGVSAGSYIITAQRDGFFPVSAQAANAAPGPVSMALDVTESPLAPVTLVMIAGGRIQGRLRDGNDRPLPNTSVRALARAYQSGMPLLQSVAEQKTDDEGQFRLSWLAPGDYVLAAAPQPIGQIGQDFDPREIDALTFYPGTVIPADSIPVTVNPGQEVIGMDFTMRKAQAVKIRGRLTGLPPVPAPGPTGAASAALKLANLNNPVGDETPGDFVPTPSRIDLDRGVFEIPGVMAGSYEIVVRAVIPAVQGSVRTQWWGRVAVEAGSKDVDGLTVNMVPSTPVRGRVLVPEGTAATLKSSIAMAMQPDGVFMFIHEPEDPVPMAADGSFTHPPLAPGDYKVRIFGLPADAYLADIRQGGDSIYAQGLRISGGSVEPIEVTIRMDGGAIEGVVVWPDQRAASSVSVVLAPSNAIDRLNSERYKIVITDKQGRFRISGIAPGPYKLFALQNMPLGAHQNSAFIAPFESLGVPANVASSSTTAVRVVVIENAAKR